MPEVAVLGSEGLIGRHLCGELESRGVAYHRIDILLSPDHDLRQAECLPLDDCLSQVDFVYFLAFDVGGSRYLASRNADFDFLDNNTQLLANTFRQIRRHSVPSVFASSQMSHLPTTSYGLLKSLGEKLAGATGGSSVRFWNVYGHEDLGEKTHVIPDFIAMALSDGEIRMRTAGLESRDFMHVRDCAAILADLGPEGDLTLAPAEVVDVATGRWTRIRHVADQVAELTGARVIPGHSLDSFAGSDNHDPRLPDYIASREFVSVEKGIQELLEEASRQQRLT